MDRDSGNLWMDLHIRTTRIKLRKSEMVSSSAVAFQESDDLNGESVCEMEDKFLLVN